MLDNKSDIRKFNQYYQNGQIKINEIVAFGRVHVLMLT